MARELKTLEELIAELNSVNLAYEQVGVAKSNVSMAELDLSDAQSDLLICQDTLNTKTNDAKALLDVFKQDLADTFPVS